MGAITSSNSLIPVLVTGIQPPRVCAVNNLQRSKESSAPKDLGALDSCDKLRNEGKWCGTAILPSTGGATW
ncbi:hypothetical protein CO666_00205 [Rhizobium chutanense]|uniref:Uncharacterized protein n=1 Tax=Rhizobium chutanense TaxID=2035448 RepID=A0A2A6JIE0_9HYPH|nr:hypothetical protein CO666_00205 [Rhizobium chutanense]